MARRKTWVPVGYDMTVPSTHPAVQKCSGWMGCGAGHHVNGTLHAPKNFSLARSLFLKSKTCLFHFTLDTAPPTATISSKQSYTNAEKVEIDVTFSEPCNRPGGFKCKNSSNCDVSTSFTHLIHAIFHASTLMVNSSNFCR